MIHQPFNRTLKRKKYICWIKVLITRLTNFRLFFIVYQKRLPVRWFVNVFTSSFNMQSHSGAACKMLLLRSAGEADDRDQAKLEEKLWDPECPLTDKQIDQFLVVARYVNFSLPESIHYWITSSFDSLCQIISWKMQNST